MRAEGWIPWLLRMGRQLGSAPATFRRIREIVNREYADDILDAQLDAYWGFHQHPEHRHYRMRPWTPVSPSRITPEQVVGIPVEEFAFIARVAMEIEDPIVQYSYQSGLGFRALLPGLGRFMGRDPESATFAAENGLDYCESAWCREEGRHGNAFLRVLERLLPSRSIVRTNPSEAEEPLNTREYALRHIDSRQATEWNASSTYAMMLAHSTGPLHDWVRNIFRDEVKHLAILSSADRYLRGPQLLRRLGSMLRSVREQFAYHSTHRSGSGSGALRSDPLLALELVYTHVLVELRLQSWLSTLPHRTLRRIFDTPSRLPDFVRGDVSADVLAANAAAAARSLEERNQLSLWQPAARRDQFRYGQFCARYDDQLDRIALTRFGGFAGLEDPTSSESREMWARLGRAEEEELYPIPPSQYPLARRALRDRLRDYQIRFNFERRTLDGITLARPNWFNEKCSVAIAFPSRT